MALTPPPPPPSVTADQSDEDLPPVDLTPRPGIARGKRRLPVIVALVLVAGALVFIAVQSLGSASMFFYNADEAIAHKDDLGDRRFRLQGTVEEGSVREADDSVEFVVFFDGAEVDVVHQGDPPELFQPNIPVVLEGTWDGDHFASDRIMVKHSSSYAEDNPDRLEPVDAPADDGTVDGGSGSAGGSSSSSGGDSTDSGTP